MRAAAVVYGHPVQHEEPFETEDVTAYLAALRLEVAKHGREKVEFKPSPNGERIGFTSPDGWWLIPVVQVRATCADELNQQKAPKQKGTAAGRYARRNPHEQRFIEWFSEKIGTAISEGHKLHSNHGLS